MRFERNADVNMIHPVAFQTFMRLEHHLHASYHKGHTHSLFMIFETWRHPMRQNDLYKRGTSKARGWQSAHQYGLAVDFVPVKDGTEGQWTWAADEHYGYLYQAAVHLGLSMPTFQWDKVHVVHPLWFAIRGVIRAA